MGQHDEAVLLMGHGTRDSDGATEFVRLLDSLRIRLPDRRVEAGFLEFGGETLPFIRDTVDRCVAEGVRRFRAVPILLHDAGHTNRDMPAEMADARARHPDVGFSMSGPLGISTALLEIIEERIRETESLLLTRPHDETAILLVGRGTTNAGANSDFFKIGRLLWERNHFGLVDCAFVSLTEPSVPGGIERCIRLGAQRVLVMPYFLHTGILVKRIGEQADALRARFPEIEIAAGQPMGVHSNLIGLIIDQIEAETEPLLVG